MESDCIPKARRGLHPLVQMITSQTFPLVSFASFSIEHFGCRTLIVARGVLCALRRQAAGDAGAGPAAGAAAVPREHASEVRAVAAVGREELEALARRAALHHPRVQLPLGERRAHHEEAHLTRHLRTPSTCLLARSARLYSLSSLLLRFPFY